MSAKRHIKKTAKIVLKPGSRRYKLTKEVAVATRVISRVARDVRYQEWLERTEPYTWSAQRPLQHQPKISIIVPVYNPPNKYFLPMVYSVVNQTYQNWELVLVNASTDKQCQQQTKDCASIDNRIQVVNLESNRGIAGNTNAGIEAASGEYIGLLDHDDLLASAALYEIVLALQNNPTAGIIYSDEDKVSASSEERFEPHFKPDWSPHLLRELNYLNHFTVIKRDLLDKVGGYRTGFDGAQDYDLFLRLIDEKPAIIHVPKVLYSWRTTETSTAQDFSKKKNILSAGIRAIEDHLKRNQQQGTVTALEKQPGFYKIAYEAKPQQKIGLVITPSPIAGQYKALIETLITNLKHENLVIELFVNKPVEELSTVPENISINHIEAESSVNFIKESLALTQAKTLLVLNAAVTPTTKHWLRDLGAVLEQNQEIGIVTPLLTTTDLKTIFDAGYIKQDDRIAPLFAGYPRGMHTYLGNSDWTRNIDAISGRCFAIRTSLLRSYVDDTKPKSEKNMHESLCEYLKTQDSQAIFWPFVRLVYRGELRPKLHKTDYFNPALSFVKEEFSVPKTINMPAIEETND